MDEPSKKVTVPGGDPAFAVTVAVRVTSWLTTDGLGEIESVVVEGVLGGAGAPKPVMATIGAVPDWLRLICKFAARAPSTVGTNVTRTWQVPPFESSAPAQPSDAIAKSPALAPVKVLVPNDTAAEPVDVTVTVIG